MKKKQKEISQKPRQQIRLSPEIASKIKGEIKRFLPDAEVYLFGSRTNPHALGGDIDILVIAKRKLTVSELLSLKVELLRKVGEMKIDIVSFAKDEKSPFKNYILKNAVKL